MSAELLKTYIRKMIYTPGEIGKIELHRYIESLNMKKEDIAEVINDKTGHFNSDGLAELICRRHSADILELLIKYGLDLSFRDFCGSNLLHISCRNSIHDYNNSPIPILVRNGFDVNIPTHTGELCIHMLRSSNYDEYKLLLENGADPNILTSRGYYIPDSQLCCDNWYKTESLLSYIIHDNHSWKSCDTLYKIVKLMIEYGADVNV